MSDFFSDFYKKKELKRGDSILLKIKSKFQNFPYGKFPKIVFAIYEGKDDVNFYENKIEQIYKGFECISDFVGSKQNVYKLYTDLDKSIEITYQLNQILFFVDKDFDDLLGVKYPNAENIFTTTFYSIENYLITSNVLRKVLKRYYNVNDNDVISKLVMEYKKIHNDFCTSFIPFLAFYLTVRKKKKAFSLENGIKEGLVTQYDYDLKKKSFKEFYELTNLKLVDIGVIELCKKEIKSFKNLSWIDVEENINILNSITEKKIFFRGKFEAWIFLEFLNQVEQIEKSYVGQPNIGIKTFVKLTGNLENKIPQDLHDFLTYNYNQLQKSKNV